MINYSGCSIKLDTIIHAVLEQQQVEQAKQLLKGIQLVIAEVALHCGFNCQSHLTKCFRETIGKAPISCRKSQRSQSAAADH